MILAGNESKWELILGDPDDLDPHSDLIAQGAKQPEAWFDPANSSNSTSSESDPADWDEGSENYVGSLSGEEMARIEMEVLREWVLPLEEAKVLLTRVSEEFGPPPPSVE